VRRYGFSMRLTFAAVAAVVAVASFKVGTATGTRAPNAVFPRAAVSAPRMFARTFPRPSRGRPSMAALNGVVETYCSDCHNDQVRSGNQSFDGYDVAKADEHIAQSEKMIRKLRTEMMPQAGAPRPGGDTLRLLADAIEQVIDRSARPNPGYRTFQRLNRPEYENVIRDLLGLEVNAADYLPLDTKSANFDNIADVQALSPALLDAYLNAAAAVSRMAVGDRTAAPAQTTYTVSPFASQHPWDHVDGAPYGTRGGIVTTHTFPADGMYQFRMNIEGGVGARLEDVDISINGERVGLLHYERGVEDNNSSADTPLGVDIYRTEPIFIKAGQHQVSAAFIRRSDGPYEDLVKPHDWSLASHGTAAAGSTTPPHLVDLTIAGPQKATGVSETPSRRLIFSCHPSKAAAERACAQEIITRLGTRAYRRPLTQHDLAGLMSFYASGSAAGGFEEGVRNALQAMLASPYFVFRFETAPPNIAPGQDYQIGDLDLATRLSFFLWGSMPDDALLAAAEQHKLSDEKGLDAQVKRMLADPRAEALATRFAAQWLRLQDVDKVRPDAFWFPDYDQQLADGMRRETELFFYNIVREDRSVLELFNANYTFVNERLARHYGIPNVAGSEFRRVTYPDSTRRGLLGQGSILVQTSLANRTSPVLRGKWVMEVLLGMPPPPPPPNVPTLDETQDAKDGRPLTTRERMELHRKNPTCNACHQYMDPIGLSLDNFDVTGKWRYRENAMLLDTRGRMYDGTPVSSPSDLTNALLRRPIPLVRAFTENLMAYAIGRRMEDADQPAIRAIARDAEASGYRMSSFVTAVVNSTAFRTKRTEVATADLSKQQR
jgi:hypothetical protein